jgi:hypothetical protein
MFTGPHSPLSPTIRRGQDVTIMAFFKRGEVKGRVQCGPGGNSLTLTGYEAGQVFLWETLTCNA